MRILAISGSLRKDSYNTALLKAMKALAPEHIDITLFDELGHIPLFNPDIDPNTVASVIALKNSLAETDGLFLSSPEYAHGISGVLKNALDWLVSGEEFVDMPVAIFNTSPRALHALDSLHEIVRTMSGNIIDTACITVPLLGSNLMAEDIVEDHVMSASITSAINAFYVDTVGVNNSLIQCRK